MTLWLAGLAVSALFVFEIVLLARWLAWDRPSGDPGAGEARATTPRWMWAGPLVLGLAIAVPALVLGRGGGLAPGVSGAGMPWEAVTDETTAAQSATWGARAYLNRCAPCHLPEGTGLPPSYPSLVGSHLLTDSPEAHARVALWGSDGLEHHHEGALLMPAFAGAASDAELAAILTYERLRFGPRGQDKQPVRPSDVARARARRSHAMSRSPKLAREPAGVPPDTGAFAGLARGARAVALLAFGLIVLGAVVRATGSGLACPDWPLCHGRLVPPLQLQVWLEWLHRFFALLVSLGVLALAVRVFGNAVLRRTLGWRVALVIALLASQIVLGALTVWKWLHVSVVTLHLGNALLFFAALLALAERARVLAVGEAAAGRTRVRRPLLVWTVAAAVATFGQILLGGLVSTSHAGLACPDFPGCHGQLFPALEGLVGLQMAHRYGAYALTVLLAFVAWRARDARDARVTAAAYAATALVGLQMLLGVLNVWLTVPVWLSAAHLATATTLFAAMVLASLRS